MEYNFREIERKWQEKWRESGIYRTEEDESRPKFYVLDMFPYPSGAGLHVGHPLGYIGSDIYARYKRQKGFNVLHPMGYDAFGLPAEQYAIQTGQHPAITTGKNVDRYREQLDKIGFSFDWERSFKTCDPDYYKWTQWTFIQLFNSYYDNKQGKALPIAELESFFAANGTEGLCAAETEPMDFTANDWNSFDERQRQETLMNYRLAYLADTWVNWCPELGTVLANDEVVNGLSVRGGFPVERKLMKQWNLRVSAYAERLLQGLDTVEWSDSLKEIQRNWIGRSEGAAVWFPLAKNGPADWKEIYMGSVEGVKSEVAFEIFTTRPDTIFGVTFMVLCPEHEMIASITTDEQKDEVESYVTWAKNRSERERQAEVKKVTGVFTGAFAVNPLTEERIPIWVSDYVLSDYGTGAIMAVPAHDSRDFAFARHFSLPIRQVVAPSQDEVSNPDTWSESMDSKTGVCVNSGFITGMTVKDAGKAVIEKIKALGIGYGTVNYRLRDAIFSRQRYWGEPFPIYYNDGMPYTVPENELPVLLPEIDRFLPTETGEPPLARAKDWTYNGFQMEYSTMPGFAGSSAYYLRYMDPKNDTALVSEKADKYWQQVDLYVGGAEHGTGHLIYARFWNKFLFDIGVSCKDEPFKKLINQGMIQGRSNFVYRVVGTNKFVSLNLKNDYETTPIHVDVNIVHNDILDIEAFRNWMPDFKDAEFVLENGQYVCGWEVEKMSKSKYNVQNPDDLVERYGADTLRMYEMFLGPIEMAKPWDTNGIEGVFRFLKKFWKLFFDQNGEFSVSNDEPTKQELKTLHKTIKKIEDDNERFSFNTAVSAFMICVNELQEAKCCKRAILEPLTVLMSAYAPHIAEELWSLLGHEDSVVTTGFPACDEHYLQDDEYVYPVSFNGKMRLKMSFPADFSPKDIEPKVLENSDVQKWLDGKTPKKIIIVPKKIVNIVF
ncbi:MAG: leucine--tRNA ligase [Bacteroidales bacterium]|nr:leucine--tRNA ligase [Bacteroidales bacterium]